MMRLIDLAHRWAGGVLGLVLAVMGLSGALLIHKHAWIALPGKDAPPLTDPAAQAELVARLLADPVPGQYVLMPSADFGLAQSVRGDAGGVYASADGQVVAQWTSLWDRPELWLFDLHHHLLAGETGETVAGAAALAACLFTITGAIMWWRTRRTFRLRLVPARWSRPAILMHHRDLGVVMAPLLLLVALTGAMMVFRPVAGAVLAPLSSPAAIEASLKPPELAAGPLAATPDWQAMIAAAHARFPGAELRIVSIPRDAGKPITIRMKQAAEWLPNGRSTLWFDPATGALLGSRDALALPAGAQAFNMVYPLHAAKVGGLAYRLVMTAVGLALMMLGLFASWSFWFRRNRRARQPKRDTVSEPLASPTPGNHTVL
jgi:uncharacterized iron-regulated membrane protein